MNTRLLLLTGPEVHAHLLPLLRALPALDITTATPPDDSAALTLIQQLKPDIVLAGINEGGIDGVQLAALVAETGFNPRWVLCAQPEALARLRADAFPFISLPTTTHALTIGLNNAVPPSRARLLALTAPPPLDAPARSHFAARTHRGLVLVPLSQVLCFVADHKYISLQHTGGELLLDETLKGLAHELGTHFVRIHRNTLVARDRISRLQRLAPGHVLLHVRDLAQPLVVSRRHVSAVRELLGA